MAIQIYCNAIQPNGKPCRSCSKLTERKCAKCDTPFLKDNKTFRVDVSVKGKRITRFAPNVTIARELEASIKADMIREEFDITHHKAKQVPTLDDLWKQYLPHAQQSKKTWKCDEYNYETHLKPRFGSKTLDSISSLDVERMKLELKKGLNKFGRPFSAASVKHYLVLLARLYTLAKRWHVYAGPNPMEHVELPRLDNQRVKVLSEGELSRLLTVLDAWPFDDSAAFIKFAVFSGFRRGELFKLQWSHVDFEQRMITLHQPKGGKTQTVPISEAALDVLRGLKQNSVYCFPGRGGAQRTDFKKPWQNIRKEANISQSFHFHDLRHNFASCLVSNGVDLAVIQGLLCHKDSRTTARYAHLSDQAMRQAAQKAGELLSPKSAEKIRKLPR